MRYYSSRDVRVAVNGRYDTAGVSANTLFLTPAASRRRRTINLGVQVSL